MWLYDADKQFPFCTSQRFCFLEVLFQCQERAECYQADNGVHSYGSIIGYGSEMQVRITIYSNFVSKSWWSTVSKAFLKSNKIPLTSPLSVLKHH